MCAIFFSISFSRFSHFSLNQFISIPPLFLSSLISYLLGLERCQASGIAKSCKHFEKGGVKPMIRQIDRGYRGGLFNSDPESVFYPHALPGGTARRREAFEIEGFMPLHEKTSRHRCCEYNRSIRRLVYNKRIFIKRGVSWRSLK